MAMVMLHLPNHFFATPCEPSKNTNTTLHYSNVCVNTTVVQLLQQQMRSCDPAIGAAAKNHRDKKSYIANASSDANKTSDQAINQTTQSTTFVNEYISPSSSATTNKHHCEFTMMAPQS